MSRACLVQVLYAEANPKRPLLKCSECVFKNKCNDNAKGDVIGHDR